MGGLNLGRYDILDRSIVCIGDVGREVLDERRQKDGTGLCVFRDIADAVAAVYQSAANPSN